MLAREKENVPVKHKTTLLQPNRIKQLCEAISGTNELF